MNQALSLACDVAWPTVVVVMGWVIILAQVPPDTLESPTSFALLPGVVVIGMFFHGMLFAKIRIARRA